MLLITALVVVDVSPIVYFKKNLNCCTVFGTFLKKLAWLISWYPDGELNKAPRDDEASGCHTFTPMFVAYTDGNMRDLYEISSTYDMLLCPDTLVSDRRPMSEQQIPNLCESLSRSVMCSTS